MRSGQHQHPYVIPPDDGQHQDLDVLLLADPSS
jgi:hypothetical protein